MKALINFLLVSVLAILSACSPPVTTHQITPAKNGEYVILLHGLARSPKSLEPMAKALQSEGYGTCNTGYPSTKRTVKELSKTSVREAVEKCQKLGARKIHFIGHSMGGMLARYHLAHEPPPEAGKLIQLPPLTHDTLIVAGRCTINPLNSRMIPGPDDGKVSIERTKAPGMKRHVILKSSHPVIMKNSRAIEESISFITASGSAGRRSN